MRRQTRDPRPDWQARVESQGFPFHSPEGLPYWDESACYVFSAAEIDQIERATYELDRMCLAAVQHVLDRNLLEHFGIPPRFHPWVRQSWETDEHTVYGRFDLALDAHGVPRLLEYNADTPTALLEAAVIQWYWLKDIDPAGDQFNSIHERLIEVWKMLKAEVAAPVYFSSLRGNVEDYMTVNYLRDTAMQAGLTTAYLAVEDIGLDTVRRQFVAGPGKALQTIFKLYPWEWMLKEAFGPALPLSRTRWFEPPWKMLLSNKAILAILWQLFPESPYLLRSDFQPLDRDCICKPLLGREGANVMLLRGGRPVLQTEGPYHGPFIFQEYCPLPQFDGHYAVLGSWMVNGHACGLGVREDTHPITQNTSRFVPHRME